MNVKLLIALLNGAVLFSAIMLFLLKSLDVLLVAIHTFLLFIGFWKTRSNVQILSVCLLGFTLSYLYFAVSGFEEKDIVSQLNRVSSSMEQVIDSETGRQLYESACNYDSMVRSFSEELMIIHSLSKELLIDPYSGDALKFFWKDNQCHMYSVGPDGVDNGGNKIITSDSLIYHPNSILWNLPTLPKALARQKYFARRWQGDILFSFEKLPIKGSHSEASPRIYK